MPKFGSREEYEAWKAGQAMPVTELGGAAGKMPADPVPPERPAKPKEGFRQTFSGLPGWAWPFIVACFAIPLITVGGALPTGLGFGAAAGCASVAKKAEWETMPRVIACAGIAGGAWILFLALVAFIAARG